MANGGQPPEKWICAVKYAIFGNANSEEKVNLV
jgi:hypothetical protein